MLELVDSSGKPNFHRIAFEEYFYAMQEGRHTDSEYVKKKAYKRYEEELKKHKESPQAAGQTSD